MNVEVKEILKKVISFDIIIVALSSVICYIFFKLYTYMLVIGLLLAALNFILNSIISNYSLKKDGNKIIGVIGSIIRIIITGSIAVLLCKDNKFNFVAFLIGYTLHYISIVLYGITINKSERK
ncbi:MAG: ATP synthase subunit I [Clostridium sp.]|uniref:ATP synthase subunit I n=1 Tax=Clostridium sp. TaxID=1506 RepID=UPI0039EAA1E5